MSIPDEFFKTKEPEGGSKAPYATALGVILFVALVIWGVMSYVQMKQAEKLKGQQGNNISIEEKQKVLDELQKKASEQPQLSVTEKQKILDNLSKKASAQPQLSPEEKQKILDELQSKVK
ncbi:MAG: hypothetical protein Q7S75_02770 [bacterium]|nr:hypothetical protein [bacterium]